MTDAYTQPSTSWAGKTVQKIKSPFTLMSTKQEKECNEHSPALVEVIGTKSKTHGYSPWEMMSSVLPQLIYLHSWKRLELSISNSKMVIWNLRLDSNIMELLKTISHWAEQCSIDLKLPINPYSIAYLFIIRVPPHICKVVLTLQLMSPCKVVEIRDVRWWLPSEEE